jgi:Flp pilus assembly protein TadD
VATPTFALGNAQCATADYSKAIELRPDYAVAFENRGIASEKIGSHDKASGDNAR